MMRKERTKELKKQIQKQKLKIQLNELVNSTHCKNIEKLCIIKLK